MGMLTDLTYVHMNASTAVDKIERRLRAWRRNPGDLERGRRIVDEMASEALRLRRNLNRFFARERRELFPRVKRIFGSGVDEVEALLRHQDMILTALDRFIVELGEDETLEMADHQVRLAYLRGLFDEFVTHYEARCEIERTFYESYSTVLYPGGLATE